MLDEETFVVAPDKEGASAKAEPAAPDDDIDKSTRGHLSHIGGSKFDSLNNALANQTFSTLWRPPGRSKEEIDKQLNATLGALIGIAPKDELEGMMGAQMVAAHNASMECYRRAMLHDQTAVGRHENLNQANKLSRTYATLLEALDRHRGKGSSQKVVVEHVNVMAGGQAVVGAVSTGGGEGARAKKRGKAHAKPITYAPGTSLRSEDPLGQPVPISGDAERPVSDARRKVARGSDRDGAW